MLLPVQKQLHVASSMGVLKLNCIQRVTLRDSLLHHICAYRVSRWWVRTRRVLPVLDVRFISYSPASQTDKAGRILRPALSSQSSTQSSSRHSQRKIWLLVATAAETSLQEACV